MTAAERVFEILDTPVKVQTASNPVPLPKPEGEVILDNVQFGYEPHIPVLESLHLTIKPGEMIGVVGKSGAGKSTLAARLGPLLDLPVIHLDAVYWRPNWQKPPRQEWLDQLRQTLQGERWIIDGNYGSTMAERIAAILLEEFGIPWARVTVSKPGAIRGARDVGVCIERGTRS